MILSRRAAHILLGLSLMDRLDYLVPKARPGIVTQPDDQEWRSIPLDYAMRHLRWAAKKAVRLERKNLPMGPCLPRIIR